jgi:murein L,D-transpeptidase YcbB/YkuD
MLKPIGIAVAFLIVAGAAAQVGPGPSDFQLAAEFLRTRIETAGIPPRIVGRVKFMFPNRFNVYLHDTPARELFARSLRTASSGCIRVEKPLELAEYLLKGDERGTRERLLAVVATRSEQTVRLPEPIDVHFLYWTSWVDGEGVLHFRDDVYGRDRLLEEAMREKASPSARHSQGRGGQSKKGWAGDTARARPLSPPRAGARLVAGRSPAAGGRCRG